MKITRRQLRRLINEEIGRTIKEATLAQPGDDATEEEWRDYYQSTCESDPAIKTMPERMRQTSIEACVDSKVSTTMGRMGRKAQ